MNPNHLRQDEIEYELFIRHVTHIRNKNSQKNTLKDLLSREDRGLEKFPDDEVAEVTSEFKICQEKLEELEPVVVSALKTSDVQLLIYGKSRLIHVLNRCIRVRPKTSEDKIFHSELSGRTEHLIKVIDNKFKGQSNFNYDRGTNQTSTPFNAEDQEKLNEAIGEIQDFSIGSGENRFVLHQDNQNRATTTSNSALNQKTVESRYASSEQGQQPQLSESIAKRNLLGGSHNNLISITSNTLQPNLLNKPSTSEWSTQPFANNIPTKSHIELVKAATSNEKSSTHSSIQMTAHNSQVPSSRTEPLNTEKEYSGQLIPNPNFEDKNVQTSQTKQNILQVPQNPGPYISHRTNYNSYNNRANRQDMRVEYGKEFNKQINVVGQNRPFSQYQVGKSNNYVPRQNFVQQNRPLANQHATQTNRYEQDFFAAQPNKFAENNHDFVQHHKYTQDLYPAQPNRFMSLENFVQTNRIAPQDHYAQPNRFVRDQPCVQLNIPQNRYSQEQLFIPIDNPREHFNLDHEPRRPYYYPQNIAPAIRTIRKAKPIYQWQLKFSGEKDLSLNDFLDQAEMLARSEGFTDEDLFASILHLLSGRAYAWYREVYSTLYSWRQFKQAIRQEFLPEDYEYLLRWEIDNRVQGKDETFGSYLTAMKGLFKCLERPMSEIDQLYAVRKGLHYSYAMSLATCEIRTLEQLGKICKRIDNTKLLMDRQKHAYIPRNALLEPNYSIPSASRNTRQVNAFDDIEPQYDIFAYEGRKKSHMPPEKREISTQTVRSTAGNSTGKVICFNCREDGHNYRECYLPKQGIFCFRCGEKDVTSVNCTKCNPKTENTKVESS